MQLKWKSVLIVNLFTLLVMSIVFIIDDRKTLEDAEDSLLVNLKTGAHMRKLAKIVESNIQNMGGLGELNLAKALPKVIQDALQKAIKEEVDVLKQKEKGVADVVDVHVTDSYGLIRVSLTGWEDDKVLKFTNEVREKLSKGEAHIDGPVKYYNEYVTDAFVPYTLNYFPSNDTATVYEGVIRILFSASKARELIDEMRSRHLLYVLLVSFSLSVLISILTVSMVIRPVRRLMEVVTEATNGNLDVRTSQVYSKDEIGKLAFGIDRMLTRIKTTQAERIEALSNLARGVAHDIKNPLNNLGLAVDNIKYVLSEDRITPEKIEEGQECLAIMSAQITRLSQITEGFLDLTRPRELDFRTVDLDDFLEKVLADFTLQFSQTGVKVVRDYCQKLKGVEIDQLRMQKAISNIVQNSIQAMSRGGKIYVTTERIVAESRDMAVISIRDTGIGIPEEIKDKIFNAYFTRREKEGGTGLGLAMTLNIIQSHNGKIEVESMEGAGTSFRITLPIIQRITQDEQR